VSLVPIQEEALWASEGSGLFGAEKNFLLFPAGGWGWVRGETIFLESFLNEDFWTIVCFF